MFVVVNVKDSGKRKIRKGRTVDSVREYKTSGSERFYIADVLDSRTGVNWNETASFIGRHSKNILLNREIILPENCSVSRFYAHKFRNILLFNTLELIFKQMYLAGCRPECVIYDPNGKYSFLLPKAARFSAQTAVITNREYVYYPVVSSLYTGLGAGVTVTDKKDALKSDAVIIDTQGTLDIDSPTLFSVSDNGITPKYAEGLNDLKALCPPYIDTIDFLGAVHQFNGDKRTENSLVRIFRHNDRDVTASEIAEDIISRKSDDSRLFFFAKKI